MLDMNWSTTEMCYGRPDSVLGFAGTVLPTMSGLLLWATFTFYASNVIDTMNKSPTTSLPILGSNQTPSHW